MKGLTIQAGRKPDDKIAKVANEFYVDMSFLGPALSLFELIGETPKATVTHRRTDENIDGFLLLRSGSLAVVIIQYSTI